MNTYKRILSTIVGTAMAVCSLSVPSFSSAEEEESDKLVDSGLDYDYARALQYSIYFYDANMCGTEVDENNRLSWRGDCHTYDSQVPMQNCKDGDGYRNGTNLSEEFMEKYKDVLDPDGDGFIDVAGGFHDAGDHVKFGIPENYAAATLGWGYYEFRDSYVKLGQDSHIETILRYFNDYLMKCTFRDKNGEVIAHCYQVGEGGIDHAIWEAPEVDSMVRPAWFLTADKPQTDYVVSACGSLAINYLNFKDSDLEYAEKSLDYAKALWKFANDNELQLSDNADGPMQFYNSSKWEDDYCWAAAWLYLATGDSSSLKQAAPYFDYYAPSGYCYNWNDMWGGTSTVWAVINQEHPELDLVQMVRDAQGKNEYVFDDFWDEVYKCYPTWKALETAGGYAFLSQWGSARYNTAMQLIGLIYDKYTNNGQPGEFSKWAEKQMQYIMGNNPLNRSYIVGYNENSVKYPHHRAASGLLSAEDTREQRHVLWGALAGGPDGSDKHNDTTNDYIYNEVTIDYNAAFVGACAGLYEFFGTPDMAVTENFPPAEKESSGEEGGGSGYWVEAVGVDDLQATTSAGVTKVSFKVMTAATKPSSKISVRYYFDSSEISNVSGVQGSTLYDQAKTEAGAESTLSGPIKYDKKDNTYYFEVAWDGYTIANSGKKYQFLMGMYYGDSWDPKNDWSYDGLVIGTDNDFFENGSEQKTDHICVYDDGVLVGGIEPDGSTPVKEEKPTTQPTTAATKPVTTTTTTTTITTTAAVPTTEPPVDEIVYGDADCSGDVNINDAVKIMSFVSNSSQYPLSDKGANNADVSSRGDGISNMDALSVQKWIAQIIEELPES